MPDYYFTFGCGQRHENGFYKINAMSDSFARKEMMRRFGNKWSMMYDCDQWFSPEGVSQQEQYGLHEIK